MSESVLKGPLKEQEICVKCGFCCDGTLFLHANLNPGERGHLPEKIEQNSFSEGQKEYFWLPCHYFSEKCTIYDRKRADVCSSYRCQLLRDFAEKKITLNDALEIVMEASDMRRELLLQYKKFSGNNSEIYFRQLLLELGKIQKTIAEKEPLRLEYEILQARCNIFEALMIKHIRSAGDFDKMKIAGELEV